jgi:hypothetical protein
MTVPFLEMREKCGSEKGPPVAGHDSIRLTVAVGQ